MTIQTQPAPTAESARRSASQDAPHRTPRDLPREPWSLRDVSVIEINLADLDHNMRVVRRIVGPDCRICPIVKADAYGLGATRIGKRLSFAGADMLAVYTPEQAGELLNAAIGCDLLVLMPLREIARVDEIYRGLTSGKVHLTVHDEAHVADLIAITERYGLTISVHLEIDTGMSRGGCAVEAAARVLQRIATCRRLRVAGIFTHFANAEGDETFTSDQAGRFDRWLSTQRAAIPADCRIHAANTFATLRHSRHHRNMVRLGLAWAGYGLEWMRCDEHVADAGNLRPIVSWRSRLVQTKTIEPSTPVGYGSRWRAKRRTHLGLVPVGYADGYPTALGGFDERGQRALVGVFDRADDGSEHGPLLGYAPVVGAVNMDQLTIDLTDIADRAGGRGGPRPGTIVELISPDRQAANHLPELARLAGTIPHAILTGLNSRIRRHYIAPIAPEAPVAAPTARPAAHAASAPEREGRASEAFVG